MPTAYTILFALIALVAVATWLIPSGAYEYVEGVPQAGTYHPTPATPQGIGGLPLCPCAGKSISSTSMSSAS